MRIIGGKFKGRNIDVPEGIRPVSLRVRKSCFDILGREIEQRRVLDLFAGSGSLGIEALSRGASLSTFTDYNHKCIKTLRNNISSLGLKGKARIFKIDSLKALAEFSRRRQKFDLVFLDPPYYKGLLRKTLPALGEYDILAPRGYIVAFCYSKDDFLGESRDFSLIVDKKYGQTLLLVYVRRGR